MLEKVQIKDAPLLRGMLSRYMAELAAFQTAAATDDAPYPYFEAYWSEPGRFPFFILEKGQRVGFILVRGPESTGDGNHQMAEFFVEPESRGLGVGKRAVRNTWEQFPGDWSLQAYMANSAAVRFWSARMAEDCVRDAAPFRTEDGDEPIVRFHFTVR